MGVVEGDHNGRGQEEHQEEEENSLAILSRSGDYLYHFLLVSKDLVKFDKAGNREDGATGETRFGKQYVEAIKMKFMKSPANELRIADSSLDIDPRISMMNDNVLSTQQKRDLIRRTQHSVNEPGRAGHPSNSNHSEVSLVGVRPSGPRLHCESARGRQGPSV